MRLAGWKTQNSRYSLRVRSTPGRAERQHHRAPARAEVPARQGPARAASRPLRRCRRRCRRGASGRAPSRAARCVPLIRIRVSMSSGRNSNAWRLAPVDQVLPGQLPPRPRGRTRRRTRASSRPSPAWGRLPNSQADSRRETGTPGVALELLEVRLARAVGIGLGEGELAVHVEAPTAPWSASEISC